MENVRERKAISISPEFRQIVRVLAQIHTPGIRTHTTDLLGNIATFVGCPFKESRLTALRALGFLEPPSSRYCIARVLKAVVYNPKAA